LTDQRDAPDYSSTANSSIIGKLIEYVHDLLPKKDKKKKKLDPELSVVVFSVSLPQRDFENEKIDNSNVDIDKSGFIFMKILLYLL